MYLCSCSSIMLNFVIHHSASSTRDPENRVWICAMGGSGWFRWWFASSSLPGLHDMWKLPVLTCTHIRRPPLPYYMGHTSHVLYIRHQLTRWWVGVEQWQHPNQRRNIDLGKLKSGIIIFQKCINVYFITFSHIQSTDREEEESRKIKFPNEHYIIRPKLGPWHLVHGVVQNVSLNLHENLWSCHYKWNLIEHHQATKLNSL